MHHYFIFMYWTWRDGNRDTWLFFHPSFFSFFLSFFYFFIFYFGNLSLLLLSKVLFRTLGLEKEPLWNHLFNPFSLTHIRVYTSRLSMFACRLRPKHTHYSSPANLVIGLNIWTKSSFKVQMLSRGSACL